MSRNRKAEIQRRLSLNAVPKPPDGLAERIKNDIPSHLEADRRRFASSLGVNMRVAASILLLVTSLVVTIHLLAPEEEMSMKTAPPAAAAGQEAHPPLVAMPRTATSAPVVGTANIQTVSDAATTNAIARVEPAREVRRDEEATASTMQFQSGGLAGRAEEAPAESRIAEAPAPAAVGTIIPAPEPGVATLDASAAPPPAASQPTRAARTSLVREAVAADLALGPQTTLFGISIDPAAFERLKTTIERGSRPAASSVNVEALVNYFAGAPKRVRRDVQLEAEGSPAPVGGNGRRGLVRFTIDTRSRDVAANATIPPVATDARVDVDFNSHAVAKFERIGDGASHSSEATLLANTSVTGLYDVELKSGVKPQTRVATIRLSYKSVADGKTKSAFVVVRGSDFARKWSEASRRHRLATLGAVWGQSLQGSAAGTDVAVRAEELATQAPDDAKARELAAAASASAGTR